MALLHVLQLYSGNPTCDGSLHNLVTVPSGYRWVIRRIHVVDLSGAAHYNYLQLDSVRIWNHNPPAYGTADDEEWIVAEPGQVLKYAAESGGSFSVTISGSHYTV